nr:hypothetical protein [uncultured Desulfuromonas sp.]
MERYRWILNEKMTIQLSSYQQKENDGNPASQPLNYKEEYDADVAGIPVRRLLELGFSFRDYRPEMEDKFFFLKYYRYPDALDHKKTVEKTFKAYHLDKLEAFETFEAFAGQRKNIHVKKGIVGGADRKFSPDNPFPELKISGTDAQTELDASIFASALYIKPKDSAAPFSSRASCVAHSHLGLREFISELRSVYGQSLTFIGKDDGFSYYVDNSPVEKSADLAVLKFPEEATFFDDNYEKYPMLQDPETLFLSAILLIGRALYSGPLNFDKHQMDLDDLKSLPQAVENHVLEVIAVVDFNLNQ